MEEVAVTRNGLLISGLFHFDCNRDRPTSGPPEDEEVQEGKEGREGENTPTPSNFPHPKDNMFLCPLGSLLRQEGSRGAFVREERNPHGFEYGWVRLLFPGSWGGTRTGQPLGRKEKRERTRKRLEEKRPKWRQSGRSVWTGATRAGLGVVVLGLRYN